MEDRWIHQEAGTGSDRSGAGPGNALNPKGSYRADKEGPFQSLSAMDGGRQKRNSLTCREHNISNATFHRWRRKYGDMDLADAKRLKELERENAELKKMLAESMLKNRVLEEVNAKKW